MYPTIQRNWGRLFPGMQPFLRRTFPGALWQGDRQRREIALTFDDGPHLHDTPQLLDVLARHGVPATFFHLGHIIDRMPDLTREAADAGHQVAIHGYRHHPFVLEPSWLLRRELDYTRALVARVCNLAVETVRDVRPPYGVFSPATLRQLAAWGYRPVMWSCVPLHWVQPAANSVRQVLRQTGPGALLVLHEGQPTGPPVAELADEIIARLQAAQFRFVTVDQLWQTVASHDVE